MIEIYPIYQNKDIQNGWIEISIILNKKKDWFNRYNFMIDYFTKKYYTWNKIINSDPEYLLKRFNINPDSENNINWITVKKAIQNWIDYIDWKIKYL